MSNIKLGIYRHYSGKEYQVMGVAKHSETLEDLVLYRPLYKESIVDYWVRPQKMFLEDVEIDGKKQKRFTFVKEFFKKPSVGIDYTGITTNFICHDGQGNFLFSKRSKNSIDEIGTWQLGGGRLEFTEEPDKGVLRELKEELGVVRESPDTFIGTTSFVREHEGQTTHWMCFSYIFHVDPQEVKNNEPQKIDEIGWYELKHLPSPIHEASLILLKKYRDVLQNL